MRYVCKSLVPIWHEQTEVWIKQLEDTHLVKVETGFEVTSDWCLPLLGSAPHWVYSTGCSACKFIKARVGGGFAEMRAFLWNCRGSEPGRFCCAHSPRPSPGLPWVGGEWRGGVRTGLLEGRADYQSQHSAGSSPPRGGHVTWTGTGTTFWSAASEEGCSLASWSRKNTRRAPLTLTVDSLRPY